MPTLTLHPVDVCVVCRCRLRGFRIGTFRINKNSLVSARGNLVFVERSCIECGHPTAHPLDLDRRTDDPGFFTSCKQCPCGKEVEAEMAAAESSAQQAAAAEHVHDCSVHTCWRPACCTPRRSDCAPITDSTEENP